MGSRLKSVFVRRTLVGASRVALGTMAIFSLVGCCGRFGAWLDIFSNFRAAYVVLLLVLTAIVACTGRVWLISCSSLLLLGNCLSFIPFFSGRTPASSQPQIRVLELNIFGGKNLQRQRTIDVINQSDADVVGISEVTKPWISELQTLNQYPYQIYEPRFGGVGLLSKRPLKNSCIKYYSEIKRPRIVATVNVAGRNVRLVFAHPVIPLYRKGSRDGELIELANDVRSSDNSPAILFGDLNATPWSYNFAKLLKDGGLVDSEDGFGFQPTWCAFFAPFSLLLPIDHCLVTEQFVVVDRRVLGNINSDHLPLQVDLAFR